MTIGGQVKQTIAALNGAQATLQALCSLESNKREKQRLQRNSERINKVIKDLEDRVSKLEFEEPQYKGL